MNEREFIDIAYKIKSDNRNAADYQVLGKIMYALTEHGLAAMDAHLGEVLMAISNALEADEPKSKIIKPGDEHVM